MGVDFGADGELCDETAGLRNDVGEAPAQAALSRRRVRGVRTLERRRRWMARESARSWTPTPISIRTLVGAKVMTCRRLDAKDAFVGDGESRAEKNITRDDAHRRRDAFERRRARKRATHRRRRCRRCRRLAPVEDDEREDGWPAHALRRGQKNRQTRRSPCDDIFECVFTGDASGRNLRARLLLVQNRRRVRLLARLSRNRRSAIKWVLKCPEWPARRAMPRERHESSHDGTRASNEDRGQHFGARSSRAPGARGHSRHRHSSSRIKASLSSPPQPLRLPCKSADLRSPASRDRRRDLGAFASSPLHRTRLPAGHRFAQRALRAHGFHSMGARHVFDAGSNQEKRDGVGTLRDGCHAKSVRRASRGLHSGDHRERSNELVLKFGRRCENNANRACPRPTSPRRRSVGTSSGKTSAFRASDAIARANSFYGSKPWSPSIKVTGSARAKSRRTLSVLVEDVLIRRPLGFGVSTRCGSPAPTTGHRHPGRGGTFSTRGSNSCTNRSPPDRVCAPSSTETCRSCEEFQSHATIRRAKRRRSRKSPCSPRGKRPHKLDFHHRRHHV